MSLAILVPVLKRPHRVAPLLASIRAATPQARVVFLTDPGDTPMIEAIHAAGEDHAPVGGNYASKINAGAAMTDEEHLFLGADDLDFRPGWYEAAKALLSDTVGVVGTNDLGSPRVLCGAHATHSLVARWYATRGTIDGAGLLCEMYPHEYVDDEFIATAMYRGAYAHAHDAVVEHLHPNWGKAPMDSLYEQQRPRMRRGWRIFCARRHLWT